MTQEKPKIEYPCSWEYKVIGLGEVAIKNAAVGAFAQREYELVFSHTSRTGKYHSYTIKTEVRSEEDRNQIFAALSAAEGIQTVI